MSGPSVSLCRLCRESCDFSINIFNPNGTNGLLVWKILKEMLQLDVCKDDGLPVTICSNCMSKVKEFKYFKAMCIKSRIEFLKASVNRGLVDSDESQFFGLPTMKSIPLPYAERNVVSAAASVVSAECRAEDPLEDWKPSIELLNRRLALSNKERGSVPPKGFRTNSSVPHSANATSIAARKPGNHKKRPGGLVGISGESLAKKSKTERSDCVSSTIGSRDVPQNQGLRPRNSGSPASASQRTAGLKAPPAGLSSTLQEARGAHTLSPKSEVSASQDKVPKAPHSSSAHTAKPVAHHVGTASETNQAPSVQRDAKSASGSKNNPSSPPLSASGPSIQKPGAKQSKKGRPSCEEGAKAGKRSAVSADTSDAPPDEEWSCDFGDCGMVFDSKRARSIHAAFKHPFKDSRDKTVAVPSVTEVVSPPASCHNQQWDLRECRVVLCDIVKSGAYPHLSCVGSESSSDDKLEESVPVGKTPVRTSGDGIRKYFSPITGVLPKASKAIGLPKTPDLEKPSTSKASKAFGFLKTPSSEKSVKRKVARCQSSTSGSEKTPSITDMFSVSPKISPIFDTPGGSRCLKSPNTSPSSDSNEAGMLGKKQLSVSLEKLPNVLPNDLGVSPLSTVVDKSSPKHEKASSDNDCVTAELGQSFVCALCSTACATKVKLHVHMKLHHKVKSSHTCELCGKSFIGMMCYKAHMKTHKPEMKQPSQLSKKSDFEMHCCIKLNHKKKIKKRILSGHKQGKNRLPSKRNQCNTGLENACVKISEPSQVGDMDCNVRVKESFDGDASGQQSEESDSLRMSLEAVISRTSDEPGCVLSNVTPVPDTEQKSADGGDGLASQPSQGGDDDLASKACDV